MLSVNEITAPFLCFHPRDELTRIFERNVRKKERKKERKKDRKKDKVLFCTNFIM